MVRFNRATSLCKKTSSYLVITSGSYSPLYRNTETETRPKRYLFLNIDYEERITFVNEMANLRNTGPGQQMILGALPEELIELFSTIASGMRISLRAIDITEMVGKSSAASLGRVPSIFLCPGRLAFFKTGASFAYAMHSSLSGEPSAPVAAGGSFATICRHRGFCHFVRMCRDSGLLLATLVLLGLACEKKVRRNVLESSMTRNK